MKKVISILLLLLSYSLNAQNLVPNPSFEQYSSCPFSYSQLSFVTNWMNTAIYPWGGSPDYYNQCSTVPLVGVPINIFGFQQAKSGVAYTGIYLIQTGFNSVREYLEVQLSNPLIMDSCYRFEMYVNLGNECQWTCTNIGVYFSDTVVAGINNIDPLPFLPQITYNGGIPFDTLNWVLVSGDYQAAGGEEYLIIGNYDDDFLTDTSFTNPQGNESGGYVYIDEVSLIMIPSCINGINQENPFYYAQISPNPIVDHLKITHNSNNITQIILYDLAGKPILQKEFINQIFLDVQHLAKGIYVYEIRSKNGMIRKGKVVKE